MGVDPRGPVFISYRHSDGSATAEALAWALRAGGVPVWRDREDLPPGDTDLRLDEALESGLSGAILLVTPEVEHSEVVRHVELPRLLELAKDSAFTFSIASTVQSAPGKLDYEAPDRLLGQRPGTLKRMGQRPALASNQLAEIARWHSRRRVEALRSAVEDASGILTLHVETRLAPHASRIDADLVLRLRPPQTGDNRPARDGLHDLNGFLGHIPQLVELAGATHVRVKGGPHLSIACALGAALPVTLLGGVEVEDRAGAVWIQKGNAPQPADDNRLLVPTAASSDSGERGPVLVYLDLVPSRSDGPLEDFLDDRADSFAGWMHLRSKSASLLDPSDASSIVGEAAHAIRELAGRHRTNQVHLLLRCPFPVALLLARNLNTLRLHLYELESGPADDGTPAEPRYLPSLMVRSGAGGGPIEEVLLPRRPAIKGAMNLGTAEG